MVSRSTGRWSLVLPWIALGAAGIGATRAIGSQSENDAIRVGSSVHVSGAFPRANHNETVVAAHPREVGTVLACSMLDLAGERRSGIAAYRSTDGGRSWRLAWRAPQHFAGDPSCLFDAAGTAWIALKTNTRQPPRGSWASDTDSLTLVSSTDGGRTWSPPQQVAQANDRPWIVADTTSAGRRGTVYAAYDGHAHRDVPSHANADFRHELVLAATGLGNANVAQQVRVLLPEQTDDVSHSSLACGLVVLSTGQVIILQHHMRLAPNGPGGGKLREVGGTLDIFTSGDGGRTLDSIASFGEVESAYNVAPSRGVTGALAVDPGSTRWRDRLYATWADYAGGRGVIRIRSSSDAGRTWTPLATVAATEATTDRFMPTIAVNRSGIVGILWYERAPAGDAEGYQPMFSASRDGGATWLAPVPLTAATNLRQQQRGTSSGAFLPNGGDTAGLVADRLGRFHAVWIDNRSGVQQAWATTIDVRPS